MPMILKGYDCVEAVIGCSGAMHRIAGRETSHSRSCQNLYGVEAMKMYRFVTTTHHDVSAETVEEAMEAFNEMKQKGLSPQFDTVIRIEVEDGAGHYIPVDRPLRAGDLDARKETQLH
jgi:hypothetical protein